MPQLETIAVVCPWDSSVGRVSINLTDFNSKVHTRWEDKDTSEPVVHVEPPTETIVEAYQASVEPEVPLNRNGRVEVYDSNRRGRRVMIEITAREWKDNASGRYVLWSQRNSA